ncbi:MAG: hypothetical protein HY913_01685 [Desulfomonile tiedjei]|nr:hypothetical protein [Desulfomonile tiedjei]
MDKIENILYSIIPLVLIIVFSWLFSLLGSKMRKQGQEAEPAGEKERGFQLFDMFPQGKEGESPNAASSPGMPRQPEMMQPDLRTGMPQTVTGAPPATPKPIEPKWWGA